MDATELARWKRFAAKGGIGKCTAVKDCVAEVTEDLMFFEADEIVVLMALEGQEGRYMGYCEGVVGRFSASDVRFHGKLKKAVVTPRRTSPDEGANAQPDIPSIPSPSDTPRATSPLPVADPPPTKPAGFLSPESEATDVATLPTTRASSFASVPDPTTPHTPEDIGGEQAPNPDYQTSSEDDESQPSHHLPVLTINEATRGQNRGSNSIVSALLLKSAPFRSPISATYDSSPFSPDYYPTPSSDVQIDPFSPETPFDSRVHSMVDASASFDQDEPVSRASIAFSDGEFGIGMQFIQGLIDQAGDVTVEEKSLGSDRSSILTEESVALPAWRRSSPLPPASYGRDGSPEELPGDGQRVSPPTSRAQSFAENAVAGPSVPRGARSPKSSIYIGQRSSTSSRRHSAQQDQISVMSRDDAREATSPAMSTFPSESDVGGYYEEDVDIYDDYRYSRYSMLSRKSRKSQLPDPRSMPSTMEAFPLPPSSLSNNVRSVESPVDRPSLDRALTQSPTSMLSSPRSARSLARVHSPGLVQPLRIPLHRGQSSDGVLDLGTVPHSPVIASARPPMLASAFRQQIEEEMKQEALRGEDVDADDLSPKPDQPTIWVEEASMPNIAPQLDSGDEAGPASPTSSASNPGDDDEDTMEIAGTLPLRLRVSGNSAVGADSSPKSADTLDSVSDSLSPQASALAQLEGRSSTIPEPGSESAAETAFAAQLTVDVSSAPFVSPSGRPLTFLPHPNAPKPVTEQTKPSQPLLYTARPPIIAPPALYNVMASAAAQYFNPRGPPSIATIHGRTAIDLANAPGPVLIQFFLDQGRGGPLPPRTPLSSIPPSPRLPFTPIMPTAPPVPEPQTTQEQPTSPTGGPIPRANFFPQSGGPRPRSRSFNGFTTSFVEVGLPIESSSKEESPTSSTSSKGFRVPSLRSMRATRTSSSSAVTPPAPPPVKQAPRSNSFSAATPNKTPPPLSIPRSSTLSGGLRSPTHSSPLSRPPMSSGSLQLVAENPGQPTVTNSLTSPTSSLLPSFSPRVGLRNTSSTSALRPEPSASGNQSSPGGLNASPAISVRSPPTSMVELKERANSPASNKMSFTDEESTRAPSVARSHSLRSKISIAALRSRSARGGDNTSESGGPTTPAGAQFEFSDETVQVKEGSSAAEFELVRAPAMLPHIALISEMDEAASTRESETMSTRGSELDGGESHRSNSPVVLMRPQRGMEPVILEAGAVLAPTDSGSIETHRAREQKWLTAMSATSSANARKNKKVKKLVQEGIPNSVRSVVWLYLTNSKARRMDGLYTQLCARGKVGATEEIQRDADRSFPAHPHLRDPQGPIVSLLQAYMIMVPDIVYQQGLAAMAGTILLQAPEEDSFWTFLALMDNHLRGYYAPNSLQLLVDSRLLQKALESVDSALAKKLFVELRLDPADLCRPWFSALFSNTLPNQYLYRVWDMFICEGAPWLFRVALTLLVNCKSHFMESRNITAADALDYLFRPPLQVLLGDPDAFIAAALAIKVKEDDLRKQRPKVEAALKATQNARPRATVVSKDLRTISGPTSAT